MVGMWDELKERNILKLILIVRFACATLDVEHLIYSAMSDSLDAQILQHHTQGATRDVICRLLHVGP
jgi:hypothetical protein